MAFGFDTDPFTQVYDELWSILEASSEFTDLVKVGNRIKVSGTKMKPFKSEASDGDMPEVIILPRGGLQLINFSSSSISVIRAHTLAITTQNLSATRHLFPLEWVIFGILVTHGQKLDLDFEAVYELSPSDNTIEDVLLNRGVEGWCSTFDINVKIAIRKDRLIVT